MLRWTLLPLPYFRLQNKQGDTLLCILSRKGQWNPGMHLTATFTYYIIWGCCKQQLKHIKFFPHVVLMNNLKTAFILFYYFNTLLLFEYSFIINLFIIMITVGTEGTPEPKCVWPLCWGQEPLKSLPAVCLPSAKSGSGKAGSVFPLCQAAVGRFRAQRWCGVISNFQSPSHMCKQLTGNNNTQFYHFA